MHSLDNKYLTQAGFNPSTFDPGPSRMRIKTGVRRLPVISDLDYFGPGDFGRISVISDGDFGRCAVKSDGDFGRCVVNSDAAVNSDGDFGRYAVNSDASFGSLLYHYFGTDIASFGWWFRTVISDGDFERCDV